LYEPFCVFMGCNPANAPGPNTITLPRKTNTEEVIGYGTLVAAGGAGRLVRGALTLSRRLGVSKLLEQSVARGPEVVTGFRIFGNKGLVGNTFNRNIVLIQAKKKGAVPIGALVRAFEAEARAAGATRLSITGHAVINPGFTPAVAQRFGFTFRQVNEETIELTKVLAP
jgi:hypothetical protein